MQTAVSLGCARDYKPQCWSCLQISSESNCPSARVGHSLIYSPNKKCVYCIGGADLEGLTKCMYKLDLNSLIWKEIPSAGFSFRYEHAAFTSEVMDKLCSFVFGGADTSGNRNDLQIWDFDDQLWKNVIPEGMPPSPRTQHSCAVSNGLLYVFGGGAVGKEPVPDRSVFVFDPQKNVWNCMETTGSSPCARQGHCIVAIEHQIYIHGGMNGEDFYDDLYMLDAREKSWTSVDPAGSRPSPRAAHGAAGVGESIYMFGGLGRDGALNDFFHFHSGYVNWQKIEIGKELLPSPRLDFAMCCVELCFSSEDLYQSPNINAARKAGRNEVEDSVCLGSESGQKSERRTLILLHGGMNTLGNIFDDAFVYFV